MGAWGKEPWDNDTAADWFFGLWEGTSIAERVQAGLASGSSEEIVAALWVAAELCRVYVWPHESLSQTVELAVTAADRILAGEDEDSYLELWEGDEEVVAQMQGLRATLADRRRPPA